MNQAVKLLTSLVIVVTIVCLSLLSCSPGNFAADRDRVGNGFANGAVDTSVIDSTLTTTTAAQGCSMV